MEEPWKKPLNGNTGAKPGVPSTFTSLGDITSSTCYIQADSDTEISSKSYGIYWFYSRGKSQK